jgi:ring-1,2-phenylacetyl-CoA epoxidase subunit PaaC
VSARRELALALADDELVLGYRESEWTGVAPLLEEDVALSSIAQDEIGHARALYVLCASLDGDDDADAVAYDRPADGFRHARFCERPRGDWGEQTARRSLYELAEAVRLEDLSRSSWGALRGLASKMAREETHHLEHARAWLDRLADDELGREHLTLGLEAVWADALGLWEPVAREPELVADGVLPRPFWVLADEWLEAVAQELTARDLAVPAAREPAFGGRRGAHSPAFVAQHAEMVSVRRLAPGAAW